jgi:hypothetical protein
MQYHIPDGTLCWRITDDGRFDRISTTKAVTYTDEDVCRHAALDSFDNYMQFYLPSVAAPWTILEVFNTYIVMTS